MNDSARAPYTDQRTRLIVLGILQLALGALAALGAIFSALSVFLVPQSAGVNTQATMLPGVVMYLIIATIMIILGAGSIMNLRWARALTLVLGWIGLAMGIFSLIGMVMLLPVMMRSLTGNSGADPMFTLIPMIFMGGCASIIYIGIPAAMILLASGRAVRMTVEYRDPVPRWTDAAPLPVLGLAILLGLSALSMLAVLVNPVIPLFGMIVTGLPAVAIGLVMGSVAAALAWGIYRQKLAAWWATLALSIVGIATGIATLLQLDLRRLYKEMGLWSPELERMGIADIYKSPAFLALAGLSWLAYLGYLLWLKRHFRGVGRASRAMSPGVPPDDGPSA